jgi:RNA polymerase sigma-70 factor (ECF subfamily)
MLSGAGGPVKDNQWRGSAGTAPPVSSPAAEVATPEIMDHESRAWLKQLSAQGSRRDEAVARLRALLVRAARSEVRRRATLARELRGGDLDDLVQQSADDALVAIMAKLDSFRGHSRFTTWAYKFALYEAAAAVRRRSWQGREVPVDPEAWPMLTDLREPSAHERAESSELLAGVQAAIRHDLSPHQREVLVAIVLNDVPIDVLAERLKTTRGALYKTIHDARQKLRSGLDARGLSLHQLSDTTP